MMRFTLLLASLILVFSLPAQARVVDVCGKAEAELHGFISQISTSCTTAADCATFYWHPDSCQSPLIANKASAEALDIHALSQLQQAVRESCKARLETRPACAAAVVPLACENGQCIDARASSSSHD